MEQIKIPARVDCLDALLDFVDGRMSDAGIDVRQQSKVLVAAEEIFINIASYAYHPGEGNVVVRAKVETERFVIEFRDCGKPFNPLEAKVPDLNVAARDRLIGGLGIYMVKKLMDGIFYDYLVGKNVLTIIKNK